MKVLVIPSWYPPNGGHFFREHSQALASLDVEVDVLACHFRSLKTCNPFKAFSGNVKKALNVNKEGNITEYSGHTWIIPFTEEPNFKSWVRKAWDMYYRYINENGKPNIVQVHSSIPAGYLAYLIYKRHKIPYVITEHRSRFVFNTEEARKYFKPWHYPIIKQGLDNCAKLVSVSNALLPKIHEISPTTANKSEVIPNMVDTDFFTPSNTKNINPGNRKFRFLTVAYLEEVKGIDVLLKAFLKLEQSDPGKYTLTIAGDGSCRTRLEDYVNINKLSKVIKFKGMQNREQVKTLMQNSDAFVLPSRFEAFGVVFIEAMSCGLPVIATKAGGPETFIPELAGKLCDINDVETLAELMKNISDKYSDYSPAKIREYAINNFSKEMIAKKYLNIYNKITSK